MSYIARRKNRIIRIAEEKADEYVKMGYAIIKDDGKVVSEPAATTIDGANAAIKSLKAENAELKGKLAEAEQYARDADEKIESLKAENTELKAVGSKRTTKASAKAAPSIE